MLYSNLFVFINCSTCFGQFHAHHQELTTEWCDRRVWYGAIAAEGCQNRLAGSMSIERFEVVLRIPQWTHYSVVSS